MQSSVFFVNISCICIAIMIGFLLIISSKRFNMRDILFRINLVLFINASILDILYEHFSKQEITKNIEPILYNLHHFTDISILYMMFCYHLYIYVLLNIDKKVHRKFLIGQSINLIVSMILIFTSKFTHFGFYIENGAIYDSIICPFGLGYLISIISLAYISIKFRKFFVTKIFYNLFFLIVFSAGLMIFQEIFLDGQYTMLTYLLPIITIFYLLHSFAYDLKTGAISMDFMNELLDYGKKYRKNYGYIALQLDDPRNVIGDNLALRNALFHFNEKYFKQQFIFHPSRNCFVLIYNRDTENPSLKQLQEDFEALHKKFKIDYRTMIVTDIDHYFENPTEFINFFSKVRKNIKINTFYYATQEDLDRYKEELYILRCLKDIAEKKDLDDERVLLYCQPIYNVATHKFSGGECLMRLNLPELGIVYPDKFVEVAEKYGFIHTLSVIILNKACKKIDEIYKQKIPFERLTVNLSFLDFKEISLEGEIFNIISKYNFPIKKIGIEITESQDDINFDTVKNIINHLNNFGIKTYLDDFGTGYSNFERIMEIPFHTIKFDKSLLQAYRKNIRNETMINDFANMFKSLGYKTLFEGIEDVEDEKLCISLGFDYLQGYRYSKPLPIDEFIKLLEEQKGLI